MKDCIRLLALARGRASAPPSQPRRSPTSRSASASRSPARPRRSAFRCKNGIMLWPKAVAGEKLNVIILDDATDPTQGRARTRAASSPKTTSTHPRLGGDAGRGRDGRRRRRSATRVQLTLSPVPSLPEGKDAWAFRLPQSTAVMAHPDRRLLEEASASRPSASSAIPTPTAKLAERHHAARREGRHQAASTSSASRAPTRASPARR